jgi:hypothetical protein
MSGQGTVEYLLDACAPCQDVSAAYTIDGVAVSDFCMPAFFSNATAACSFTGSLRGAFEPAVNGVVTWLADDGLLYQARADNQGWVRVLGGFSLLNAKHMLLRELVDMLTPDRLPMLANAPRIGGLLEAEQNARRARLANLTRFGDEIAWRFGHASAEPVPLSPRRETERAGDGGGLGAGQRQRVERAVGSAL